MSRPSGGIYDGNYFGAPYQHGLLITNPDRINFCNFYRQTMRCRISVFKALPIGYKTDGFVGSVAGSLLTQFSIPTGYLYEETEPHCIGGDLVEWERLSCAIPPPRAEGTNIAYTRQYLSGGSGTSVITEISKTESALTTYLFAYSPTGSQPTGKVTGRYVILPDGHAYLTNPIYIGTAADGPAYASPAGLMLAENSEVTRFKGFIFEEVSRYIAINSSPVAVPGH